MAIRGLLAYDDNGDLVQIDPNTATPNDPPESDIEPVTMRDLVVTGVVDDNLDLDGNDIADIGNLVAESGDFNSVSTEDTDTERLAEDHHLAGSYPGEDADARLDAALSASTNGDIIIPENTTYSADRTVTKRVRFLGSGGFQGSGTSIGGQWTFDVAVTVDNVHLRSDTNAEIVLNGTGGRLINISGPSSQKPVTVNGDDNTIIGCRGLDVTFESGAEENVIGLCATTNATDDDGSNYIGPAIN